MGGAETNLQKAWVRDFRARSSLLAWLSTFDRGSYSRGKQYYRDGHVLVAKAVTENHIDAVVLGSMEYDVTLACDDGLWSSLCDCPIRSACKHAVAAGLAWANGGGRDFPPNGTSQPVAAERRVTKVGREPRENGITFADKWAPTIEEKLGRRITREEIHQLRGLWDVFQEFQRAGGRLSSFALQQCGLGLAIPPDANSWDPLFRGWWTANSVPSDPWELWQILACGYYLRGSKIPDVFQPLTETAATAAKVDAHLARVELKAWREARDRASIPDRHDPVRGLRDSVEAIRARITVDGGLMLEVRAPKRTSWKAPSRKWIDAALSARPADLEFLSASEVALLLSVKHANGYSLSPYFLKGGLDSQGKDSVLASHIARGAVVLPDGAPFPGEVGRLVALAVLSSTVRDRLEISLATPDGSPAEGALLITASPEPLYLHEGAVWRGPPPLPSVRLPVSALSDPEVGTWLRSSGLRLPKSLELKTRVVKLRPVLKLSLSTVAEYYSELLNVDLFARADEGASEQVLGHEGKWRWTDAGAPASRGPDDPVLEFDLSDAQKVADRFSDFGITWNTWTGRWTRPVNRTFADDIIAWRATLPDDVVVEASPQLAALFRPATRASVDFSAIAADSDRDWFDVTIALRVEDTTLSKEEIALLLKARGKWVRLPRQGWRRLEPVDVAWVGDGTATLDRLGIGVQDVIASGGSVAHRVHALQLAAEADVLEARDAKLAQGLRERVASLKALPEPRIPEGFTAALRPYQHDGFRFLAHLSGNGLGGVLADDMGLGKTVQALAWLVHLRNGKPGREAKFRALVVCPKSVVHGWISEAARFAPMLRSAQFVPDQSAAADKMELVVANYSQLRLNADWFCEPAWDAVILDEGQFIKNPASKVAGCARSLRAGRRLVLTGTPIENRLTDLWSLFAFAQPGLLGSETAFRRQYSEKDPEALSRLHRRVSHFLLRRTKSQAAPDLPPRTELDLVVELEPGQRKLYDAELKRARQQLLGIESDHAFDKVRFNVLASLLRLRQICCHPALVDPVHAGLSSAKLDALIERLIELRDEGHQVLVFSQFVQMLELIRARLVGEGVGHLMLTGATENRAALVDEFQRDRSRTVFLLSLKAAGFGLNLTAASYAILFDPWWNPAVESQAIDRTHRIGQERPVFAYRLLAENTVEEKIRALQREKAELAAAVVQEQSLAKVLYLESLRRILS